MNKFLILFFISIALFAQQSIPLKKAVLLGNDKDLGALTQSTTDHSDSLLLTVSHRPVHLDSIKSASSNISSIVFDSTVTYDDSVWVYYDYDVSDIGNILDSLFIYSSSFGSPDTISTSANVEPESNLLYAPYDLLAEQVGSYINISFSDSNQTNVDLLKEYTFDDDSNYDDFTNYHGEKTNNESLISGGEIYVVSSAPANTNWPAFYRDYTLEKGATYTFITEGKVRDAIRWFFSIYSADLSYEYVNNYYTTDNIDTTEIVGTGQTVRVFWQGNTDATNEMVSFPNIRVSKTSSPYDYANIYAAKFILNEYGSYSLLDTTTDETYRHVISFADSDNYRYYAEVVKDNEISGPSNLDTVIYAETGSEYIATITVSTSDPTADYASVAELNAATYSSSDIIGFKSGDEFGNDQIDAIQGVTYTSYGGSIKPKFGSETASLAIFDVDVNGVTIDNLEIEGARWVFGSGIDTLTISNCDLHLYVADGEFEADVSDVAQYQIYMTNVDHFTLRDSEIRGNFNSAASDMIMIHHGSQYTLIENNYIEGGAHTTLYFKGMWDEESDSNYNDNMPNHSVVRGNHFWNHSHHIITHQVGAWGVLVENNFFGRAGTGVDSSDYYNRTYQSDGTIGAAFYNFGKGSIFRNNIVTNSGSGADFTKAIDHQARYQSSGERNEVIDHAIYNNVFYNNHAYSWKTGVYQSSSFTNPINYRNVHFINNAFGGGTNNLNAHDFYIFKNGTDSTYKGSYKNNLFSIEDIHYGTDGSPSYISVSDLNISGLEDITANGNIHATPSYESPNSIPLDGDVETAFSYFVTDNVNMVDQGTYLASTTTTNSSTNSITLQTGEGAIFSDGFGVIQGDSISVQGDIAIITDVTGDVLTLDRNIDVSSGDYVTRMFSGTMPNIGLEGYKD